MVPSDLCRRFGFKPFPIASILGPLIALGAYPIAAQDDGFSCGAAVHLGTLLGGNKPSSGNSAVGKVGSGVEGLVIYRWSNLTETRFLAGFTGIRAGSWQDSSESEYGGEYWRSLRFGLEQSLDFRAGAGGYPYVFAGGGVQETWVALTSGNLSGATFAVLCNLFTNAQVDYRYAKYSDSLDTWGGYGTVGAGWRFKGAGYIEVRAVVADRQEFLTAGLTTLANEPKVYRRGVQCFLTFGLRSY